MDEFYFKIVFWVVSLTMSVVCAIFCARIADRKGYSKTMGGLLGWCCTLIGLLIVYLLPDKYAEFSSYTNAPNPNSNPQPPA